MTMNNGGANESNPNRKFFLGALVLALIYYLSGLDCMQGCIREIVLVGAVLLFLYTFAGVKEFVRKRLVGLKRKPQIIAMLVLGVGFVYYSLNLTHVSNTTAYIQGTGMGLSGFVVMLFSVLSLVCFLNAFPHRKKVNIPMLVLMFLMLGAIIFCDVYYGMRITEALTRENNPIVLGADNNYIAIVQSMLKVHMGIVIASGVLVALLPVYKPLIRKINTSVEVAANENMGELELEDTEN